MNTLEILGVVGGLYIAADIAVTIHVVRKHGNARMVWNRIIRNIRG